MWPIVIVGGIALALGLVVAASSSSSSSSGGAGGGAGGGSGGGGSKEPQIIHYVTATFVPGLTYAVDGVVTVANASDDPLLVAIALMRHAMHDQALTVAIGTKVDALRWSFSCSAIYRGYNIPPEHRTFSGWSSGTQAGGVVKQYSIGFTSVAATTTTPIPFGFTYSGFCGGLSVDEQLVGGLEYTLTVFYQGTKNGQPLRANESVFGPSVADVQSQASARVDALIAAGFKSDCSPP